MRTPTDADTPYETNDKPIHIRARAAGLVRASTILAAWSGPAQAAAKHHHARVSPSIVARTTALLRGSIKAFSTRSGPNDQQYFANGVWHSSDNTIWNYNLGPGTAAAVLWRATGQDDARLRRLAIETFDTLISTHRNPNGSFGQAGDSPDITSMMVGVDVGTALLEMESTLGPRRAARWRSAVAGAADFLIRNGNLTWYTNGNINIGNTDLFYLAWRASGAERFRKAYNQSWAFTLHPPQDRWPGFGLQLLDTGSSTVGNHGAAGYLAESGGGQPGFDPEYAGVQLDVVSHLYILSSDPRALPTCESSSQMRFSPALVERGFSIQAVGRVTPRRIGMCRSRRLRSRRSAGSVGARTLRRTFRISSRESTRRTGLRGRTAA